MPSSNLDTLASKGYRPKFVKISNQIRYKLSDVEAFEEANTVTPE